MKWRLKNIILLAIFGAIIYLGVAIYIEFKNSKYSPLTTFSAPKDYIDLFNNSAREKIFLKISYVVKGRNPITIFEYDTRWIVSIYKLNIPKNISLNELVKQDREDVDGEFRSHYTTIAVDNFQFSYTWDSIPNVKRAWISLYGKYLKTNFQNENIVSFTSSFKKFYIRYGEKKLLDIFFEKRDPSSLDIPTEIITIKKDAGLYFVFVNSKENNGTLNPNLVKDLLNIDQ